jgi:hypothetical protein
VAPSACATARPHAGGTISSRSPCRTRAGQRTARFRGGQQLAAGLPDAQLVALEGAYHPPDAHDLDTVADAVVAFLNRPELS